MVSSRKEKKTLVENFTTAASSPLGSGYMLFRTVLNIAAIFLSLRCNGKFELGDMLLACCCPELYVAYRLALDYNKCFPKGLGN
jgi:hypothetical protein